MVGTSNQSVPEMAIDPLFLGIFHGINQVPGDPPGNSTVHPGQGQQGKHRKGQRVAPHEEETSDPQEGSRSGALVSGIFSGISTMWGPQDS